MNGIATLSAPVMHRLRKALMPAAPDPGAVARGPAKPLLLQTMKAALTAAGFEVGYASCPHVDVLIRRDGMKCWATALAWPDYGDRAASPLLIDHLVKLSCWAGDRTDMPTLFVTGFALTPYIIECAATRGLTVLRVSQLEQFTRLGTFDGTCELELRPDVELLVKRMPMACLKLAQHHTKRGDLDAALLWAERAGRPPASPSSLFVLANVYSRRKQFDDAAATLTRAILLDPANINLRHARIQIEVDRGDLREAIAQARTASEGFLADPSFARRLETLERTNARS